jgi:hypothetical protein
MALEWEHPNSPWNWPIVISIGMVLQFVGVGLRRRAGHDCHVNTQSRALSAIWGMMGVTLMLYCFTAIFTHKLDGPDYIAAIFMTIGLAHAASAIILRWPVQGAVAVLWWAGGLACFFLSGIWYLVIFGVEMFFGMILFGLYAMMLERNQTTQVTRHA